MAVNMLRLKREEPGVLVSQRLDTSAPTVVLAPPDRTAYRVATASLTNTTSEPVAVSVSVLESGDADDGTHSTVTDYSLEGHDVLSLRGLIPEGLQPGESVSVTAGTPGAVCVVATGSVCR